MRTHRIADCCMAQSRNSNSRLVYSTGVGRLCPGCLRSADACVCKQQGKAKGPARAGVRVGRETKGRSGKGVTVITGLALSAMELEQLGTDLKKRCGSGGTVRDGVIEIQGDHRDTLVSELIKRGWDAKRSGG